MRVEFGCSRFTKHGNNGFYVSSVQPRPFNSCHLAILHEPNNFKGTTHLLFERLLTVGLPVVYELTGGDAFGSTPVGLGDVVFEILEADAPQAPSTDLDGAKLSSPDQGPDEGQLHVELLGGLPGGQEAALPGLIGHQLILWGYAVRNCATSQPADRSAVKESTRQHAGRPD